MGYVDYEYYKSLYGDKAISGADFNRLSWDACRKLDIATTGVDNVKKLKFAFPTNEDDAEAVKRCICKLIEIAVQIEESAKALAEASGYITDEATGAIRGKVVASKSSGSESISYVSSASGNTSTLIDKALSDKDVQDKLYNDTITDYLSGVPDANGVNLLFVGPYPGRLRGNYAGL